MAAPARKLEVENTMDVDKYLALLDQRTDSIQRQVAELWTKLDAVRDSVSSLAERTAAALGALEARTEASIGALSARMEASYGLLAEKIAASETRAVARQESLIRWIVGTGIALAGVVVAALAAAMAASKVFS